MSSVRPSFIAEETYNKIFELVGLPKKVGFPFALDKLLEKHEILSQSKRYED
jgi:hypothetical protein